MLNPNDQPWAEFDEALAKELVEHGEGVKCGLAEAREYLKIAPTVIPAEGTPNESNDT